MKNILFGLMSLSMVSALSAQAGTFPLLTKLYSIHGDQLHHPKRVECHIEAGSVTIKIRNNLGDLIDTIERQVRWTKAVPNTAVIDRLLEEADHAKIARMYTMHPHGLISTYYGSYKRTRDSSSKRVKLFRTHSFSNQSPAKKPLMTLLNWNCRI